MSVWPGVLALLFWIWRAIKSDGPPAGRGATIVTALLGQACASIEPAREALRQTAGEDCGTVRAGVTPYLTLTALGQAFLWLRQRYQQVGVQLIEGLMTRVLPRLRDGTLDIAAVATEVGEIGGDEFNCQCILQAPPCLVLRADHPVLADTNARALCALECVLTLPLLAGQQPCIDPVFARAGVAPPTRVIQCGSLAAMTILRNADAVSLLPRPLLGHTEARGLVAIDNAPLRPCDIELLQLTQSDVPLAPAAASKLHCLRSVSQGAAAAGPARVGVGAGR